MTKIEQTLALAVVAIKARRVQVSDPTQLSALPSNAELDDLREWVTAALPVVEAVQELQEAAGVRVHGPWMEANEAFRLARNKVLAVACPVSK